MFVAHLIIDAPDILVFVRDTPGPVEDLPARVVRRQVDPSEDLQRRSSVRSEEHTSELQSPCNLVCRLLLEKKKKTPSPTLTPTPTPTPSPAPTPDLGAGASLHGKKVFPFVSSCHQDISTVPVDSISRNFIA